MREKTLFEKTSSDTDDPMTVVFRSGANYLMQYKSQSQAVLTEKVKRVMDVAIDKEVEKYENKLITIAIIEKITMP
mgnify:CR=1 FL=1